MAWTERTKVDMMIRDITALGGGFFTLFLSILLFIVDRDVVAWRLLIGFALIYPAAGLLRYAYFKKRPYPMPYSNLFEKLDASSFPSIHAANSFYAAYVLHNTFASNPLSAFLFLLAVFVALSRVYMKRHYPIDVAGGAALGAVAAYLTVNVLLS